MRTGSPKTHPSEVSGKLRTWRTRVGLVLGAIFLVLPWVRISGRPLFLFDIPGRRFSVFGQLFWAQDLPLLLYLAGGFILFVLFMTAIFGRVWCGWACPQTVFIDLVFRRIEGWIEGDSVTRRRRDAEPLDFDRVMRKGMKWALFVFASGVISHSVLAYFTGTERLGLMIAAGPSENPEAFGAMILILGVTLFNFGWFRERFCSEVCPYGRLQTVLLDEKSWVVAYDSKRPDCIDCRKCVTVCPAGIDIRKGLQLECIGCTACIDACDPVMAKIGKPPGLIRYSSVSESGSSARPSLRKSVFRARPVAYGLALLAVFAGLSGVLATRERVDIALARATGNPYEVVDPGMPTELVVNRYSVDFHNRTFESCEVLLSGTGANGVEVISSELPFRISSGDRKRIGVFVRFPANRLRAGALKTALRATMSYGDGSQAESRELEVSLVGPYY